MKRLRHLALLSVLLTVVSCSRFTGAGGVDEGRTSYRSGGKKIVVETFVPADGRQHPAVLVLYGSGGLLHGKGDMVAFSRQLAARGMGAYMLHYFDRTGTLIAGDKSIAAYSRLWQDTVKDGIDFISRQPQVRPGQMGAYGYSLGAFLSVGAAVTDSRIGAAAELSGGLFDRLKGRARRYPPLLILHGSNDARVLIHYADELEQDALRFHVQPAVHIYPGEGHAFSPAALTDASARALNFLQQHLRP